ncbi:MAG: DUF2442 domain-containing protein [Bacteroidales bacterium]|nr:DUF2442 domain-containing protein [Bacteroidales bacterium]
MESIVSVKVLLDYNIKVEFEDGFLAVVCLKPLIGEGISEKLLDYDFFTDVKIDDLGGLYWPNGFDICPNFLREIAEKATFQIV